MRRDEPFKKSPQIEESFILFHPRKKRRARTPQIQNKLFKSCVPPMPPKRKTLAPQRSSERLKIKMSKTLDKSPISPIDLSTPTPLPEKKKHQRAVTTKKPTSSGPEQEQDDETPIRHHLIVTREDDVKRYEELDDCFILGFDPIGMNRCSVADNVAGSPEIAIVAEKGQVWILVMTHFGFGV